MTALGYDGKKNDGTEIDTSKGLTIGDFNEGVKKGAYEKNSITEKSGAQRLLGQKFTVNYAGQKKEIEFLNEADLIKLGFSKDAKDAAGNDIKVVDWDKVHDTTKDANGKINGLDVEDLKVLIQERMDKAFGTGKVKVDSIKTVKDDGTKTESLTFNTTDTSQTLTVSAVNTAAGKDLIGINGASNKVSLGGTLKDNAGRLGLTLADPANGVKGDLANGLTINGVKLEVDETTTVQSLLDQINNNKEIGVRATYLSGENTFALVSTNTGSGRGITFGTKDETDGGLAAKIFGDGKNVDGTDAEMLVSYGEGLETVVKSSSNTFDLEGMEVTVSGNFNVEGTGENVHVMPKDKVDRSKAVTFNAKADVDGALDAVKKFIEEYNALIKEVNTQISTKPSGSYKPLTDEQKDEMSEKEIENWEKKAKEGLLFNDPTLRDLNSDLQGIFAEIIGNGVKPEDLEKIGITASSDWFSGGELIFDEEKFKDAMNTEPELVSNVICGGGTAKKGLAQTIEDTLTRYATRFSSRNQGAGGTGKGTYGRLIEEAGSEKIPSSMKKNLIDEQLKTMQENLDKLKEKLSVEQDRYISQFATMEKLISQMNSQSGWLASLTA